MKGPFAIIVFLFFLVGCQEDTEPIPYLEENDGSIVLITNQSATTYDLRSGSKEFVSFDLDIEESARRAVSSVGIQMVFTNDTRIGYHARTDGPWIFTGDSVYQAVEIMEVTSFPTTVTVSLANVLSSIPEFETVGDFLGGDFVELFFQVKTMDGRTLTNSADLELCLNPDSLSSQVCKVAVRMEYPFNSADAVGAYRLVEDGFPASLSPLEPIIAIAGPGENDITLVDLFKHSGAYDIILNVDPTTSMVHVERQYAFEVGELGAPFECLTRLGGWGVFNLDTGEVILLLGGSCRNTEGTVHGDFGIDRYILEKIIPVQ